MHYHNHRLYCDGKRKGKTTMELLAGKEQTKDWIEILFDTVKKNDPELLLASQNKKQPVTQSILDIFGYFQWPRHLIAYVFVQQKCKLLSIANEGYHLFDSPKPGEDELDQLLHWLPFF